MLLTEEEATSRWCPFARVALSAARGTDSPQAEAVKE